ncbi:MAG: shikimate dehydrogenase [Candidatus Bathyarchaeota archaeon]|nr:shikimate dehydrogenase [Candidatus Bathyarchaeota archaeon]
MRRCYLIGYPVEHSMSALMHNAAFEELGLGYLYELKSVRPEALGRFTADEMRGEAVRGANVTIPHKVSIMGHLDEAYPEAAAIGAVNTIVNEGGWLKGYNTDGRGAMRALEETYGDLRGAKVILVGAGGAARAIGRHLSIVVDELSILNRTASRAESLVSGLKSLSGCNSTVTPAALTRENLKSRLVEADVLINATPLGMTPDTDKSPVDSDLLHPGLLVFDTVYNPLKTRLLREAEEAGARTLTGAKMLAYQGAASFELWTGVRAPEELMFEVVVDALRRDRR